MRTAQELDKAGDDAALDDLLDGRIALLREQLAELGRRVELSVHVIREDALDHRRQRLGELQLSEALLKPPTRLRVERRGHALVVAVRIVGDGEVATLGRRLLALLLADLDLRLLAPSPQLVRLEHRLVLEVRPAVLEVARRRDGVSEDAGAR